MAFMARQEDKSKRVYEQFMKLIEADQAQDYVLPNKLEASDDEVSGAQSTLRDLEKSQMSA